MPYGARKVDGVLPDEQKEINAAILPVIKELLPIIPADTMNGSQKYAVEYLIRGNNQKGDVIPKSLHVNGTLLEQFSRRHNTINASHFLFYFKSYK